MKPPELRATLRSCGALVAVAALALTTQPAPAADAPPPAVENLATQLASPDRDVKREAVYQLEKAGPAAKPALPALIKALDDNDKQVWNGAIAAIAKLENIAVDDLYHNPHFTLSELVKFKHVKDPQSGQYTDLPYPNFIGIPFNPATDDYPYPTEAIGLTYDGLHPSDKGCAIIAKSLVKIMKKF